MKRKFLLSILSLLTLPAFAERFVYTYAGQKLTYEVIDESARTCSVCYNYNLISQVSGEVIVPETAVYADEDKTYTVIAIGNYALCRRGITAVTIPSTVTEIGNNAFDGAGISSLNIPNSVVKIGTGAFARCSNLASINIPESITAIENDTFSECRSLSSVIIPTSVTSIGEGAFNLCSSLTSVTIPNSVKSIGYYAFQLSGLRTVTIPNSVTELGEHAFALCSNLTSVTLSSALSAVSPSVFYSCENLKEILVDPSNKYLSSVDGVLFDKKQTRLLICPQGLQGSYTILNTVNAIGDQAFSRCFGLTAVNIPNSVKSIGMGAFFWCYNLTDVNIPGSVTSIGDNAFNDCYALAEIDIPDSVTSLGMCAFMGCESLTNVKISNALTRIDVNTFCGCTRLSNVTIPESVIEIGSGAFSGCMTNITIPKSVKEIAYEAFSGCSSLTKISVDPENQYYCSVDGVLLNKEKTKVINYPIGKQGHYTVPNSVNEIELAAFSHCTGLTSVVIPNSVTKIGNYAFDNCEGLTSATIPGSVVEIGSGAFWGCSNLTEFNYNTVAPISAGNYVFSSETYDTATLYVAIGGLEAAKQTSPWNRFKNIQEKEFIVEDEDPSVVIVKLPGGNLHLAEEHAGTTVRLTADDGFEFHSASLDDEDVSHLVGEQGHFTVPAVEKPSVLNVVFKQTENQETAINAIGLEDEVRVTVHGKRVRISGKDASTAVRAYDLRGILLDETTDSELTLDYGGVVILRVGPHTFKFAL